MVSACLSVLPCSLILNFAFDFTIASLKVLASLGTETVRPSSAAQCVAYIACAELPQGMWPDLITSLTHSVTNQGSTEMMKESSLEAIGYICQDIVSSIYKNAAPYIK